jgi:hypothetical protein
MFHQGKASLQRGFSFLLVAGSFFLFLQADRLRHKQLV